MLPQISLFPLSYRKSSHSLRSAALAAALAVVPGVAFADSADSSVSNVVPQQLVVESNGSSYHSVSPFANLTADLHIEIDTGTVGRVKSWKIWLGLGTEDGEYQGWPHHSVAESYPWYDRPRHVDRTEALIVPSVAWGGFVKARCNALADELRAQGLGNAAIFAQDRKIALAVYAPFEADTTGAGSNWVLQEAEGWALQTKIDLVCKKWGGAAVPQASNDVSVAPPKVVDHGLSIQELYGPSGLCKIRLHGSITTDRKNAEVSFRYRNEEGKQSQVQTVNTGESKTATFSHDYDIANGEWAEIGGARMVGLSHDFESEMATYTMDCVDGVPQTLTTILPPTLKMTIVEQGKVMVQGQICPERLKLVGVLEGRGNVSGSTVFFGPGFLSPRRDYTITEGQKVLVGADAELKWDHILALGDALLTQKRSFTFNATDESDKVIASLPNQTHTATCVRPAVNPVVGGGQGGLTIQPRQPAAPAATLATPKPLQQQTAPAPQLRRLPAPQRPRQPAG